jgi:uncharacterized damage-inducible protein DinB
MSGLTNLIGAALLRDLRAVKREIEAYPTEADIWRAAPGVTNTGGTLALHVAGNLQHFIGAIFGQSGYIRNRDAEFARRDVSRTEIIAELDRALSAVHAGMARVSEADLARDFPQQIGGKTLAAGDALLHLATHLTYHLGQIDYHRRLTTSQGVTVGTLPVAELFSAR